MAKITSRGQAWELKNSIWMLWAILSMGFFNYISFFYTSYKVKQRKWFIAGIVYSILFILCITALEYFPEDHWFFNVSFALFLIGWIASIIHVFKIRAEYLLRLDAKLASRMKEKELETLKHKIAQEYGQKTIKDEKVVSQEVTNQEITQEETPVNILIDINNATEEEIAKVPGIGGLFAKKVVLVREEIGGFKSFDHFVDVLSFKPHLVGKIKPHITFSKTGNPEQKMEGRIIDF